jgi:CrcB protein
MCRLAGLDARSGRGASVGVGVGLRARVAALLWTLRRAPWSVLGVVAAGGVAGAEARYALAVALQSGRPDGFPWATFMANVSGCLLIGILIVLITEVWSARRLLRPFLGVGVLGGYTTFSTYVVDVQRLIANGAARTALGYLAGTLFAALASTYVGIWMARLMLAGLRGLRE